MINSHDATSQKTAFFNLDNVHNSEGLSVAVWYLELPRVEIIRGSDLGSQFCHPNRFFRDTPQSL
jgi:hypothetical protein